MYPIDTIGATSAATTTGGGPAGLSWKVTLAIAALGGAFALYSWPAYRAWERRAGVGARVGAAVGVVGLFIGGMQLAIQADTKRALGQ